ncbi:hypothetical protein MMC13_000207 [Lambiella insularis]|nr:hypothetical protein [Lambiella insularis]
MDGTLANGVPHSSFTSDGLRVIIVGGGIGGFTAGIALRRQGHYVTLYEQSRFANEIGAAIHITPNADGLLRRLGVRVEEEGAVHLEQTRLFKDSGQLLNVMENTKESNRWQNPWYQAHRAHLHKHLKDVATSPTGEGEPITVNTSSKVVGTDPHEGIVTLHDGTQVRGDAIIGADGVHSVARAAINDWVAALADPVTHDLATIMGSLDMWYGPDRKMVLYPCYNNTLLNFVCIHPAELSETTDDYNKGASKQQLLDIYRDFEPKAIGLLMNVIPTHSRCILSTIWKLSQPSSITVWL